MTGEVPDQSIAETDEIDPFRIDDKLTERLNKARPLLGRCSLISETSGLPMALAQRRIYDCHGHRMDGLAEADALPDAPVSGD